MPPAAPTPRRALIAEPETATHRLCRDVLENVGYTVDVVDSGVATLIAARDSPPSLILIALQLRDVPGREVVGWLRSDPVLRSMPIIILTDSAEEDAAWGTVLRCAALRKPLSPGSLRRAIDQVLG